LIKESPGQIDKSDFEIASQRFQDVKAQFRAELAAIELIDCR
jgi:hypothetical protein